MASRLYEADPDLFEENLNEPIFTPFGDVALDEEQYAKALELWVNPATDKYGKPVAKYFEPAFKIEWKELESKTLRIGFVQQCVKMYEYVRKYLNVYENV